MPAARAPGPLHGLPLAVKDLHLTAGIRTTFGSPLFADFVPPVDSLLVARERAAGAIVVGKTNVPEFGAGSQTFNTIFGATLNPYDLTKTCGGSSGGAAVALACGMVPLADGSDMGGSLRNPASFCNVVGLRPSPGRVPSWPAQLGWQTLGVEGPMGRTVADVALLLSAVAGPDSRCPISLAEDGARFRQPLGRDLQGTKVAWATLGLPYEPAVREVVDATRSTFEALGCIVEDAEPDLTNADDIFHAWRALIMQAQLGPVAADPERRHLLKDTLRWNVERAAHLTGPQLANVELARTALVPADARVHDHVRRARAARQPGAALRRDDRVGDRDRRGADGHLHRLDALVLVDHGHRAAGHLRARVASAGAGCRWACRSSAAPRASGTSSRWRTPSSRPHGSGDRRPPVAYD